MRYGGGGGTKTAQQCDPFFHRALTHYPLDWRGFTGQKSSQIRTKQHVFDIFSTHIQTDAISGPRGRGFKSRHSDQKSCGFSFDFAKNRNFFVTMYVNIIFLVFCPQPIPQTEPAPGAPGAGFFILYGKPRPGSGQYGQCLDSGLRVLLFSFYQENGASPPSVRLTGPAGPPRRTAPQSCGSCRWRASAADRRAPPSPPCHRGRPTPPGTGTP